MNCVRTTSRARSLQRRDRQPENELASTVDSMVGGFPSKLLRNTATAAQRYCTVHVMLTANGFARNPHHRTKCESHRGVALVCGRLTLLLSLALLLHWHFAKLDATAFLGCVTHARRLADCVAVAACSLALTLRPAILRRRPCSSTGFNVQIDSQGQARGWLKVEQ